MNEPEKKFRSQLARLRLVWQCGLVVRLLMRLAGIAAVVLLVYAALDFSLGFSQSFRVGAGVVLLVILTVLAAAWLIRILRLDMRSAAERADLLAGGRRRSMLSALELTAYLKKAGAGLDDLSRYLLNRSVRAAERDVAAINLKQRLPLPEIGKQARAFFLQLIIPAFVFAVNMEAGAVVLRRLLMPWQDVPPFSKYSYIVNPESPQVVYGGTGEVSVEILGGPIESQVWLLTRHKDKVHRSACFQESRKVFAQKLEKVTRPVDFCFRMGRTRSRWHSLELLMQPRIAAARVEVTPPRYSGKPVRQFYLGSQELAALPKSKIRLSIGSNRPLLDGRLTIKRLKDVDAEKIVAGRKVSGHNVDFEWTLLNDAELVVTVRDIRGTPNREPLRIRQKVVADSPPVVEITDPPCFSLATPRAKIAVGGYAEDDLGLHKVELVRGLVGFHDRRRPLDINVGMESFKFRDAMDLGLLGVEPGQTLEFYVEARDLNPDLTGVSESEMARVQVISEKEYESMLRSRETLDEFMRRFRRAEEDFHKLKEALKKLKDSAESGADEEEIGERIRQARESSRKARDLFDKLAADFMLYDLERDLKKLAARMGSTMDGVADELARMQPSDGDLVPRAENMLKKLGAHDQQMGTQMTNARQAERIRRLMQCASEFKKLVRRQRMLVRQMERFRDKSFAGDSDLLHALGKRQDEIREKLLEVQKEIQAKAEDLTVSYRDLKQSALDFAGAIGSRKIPGTMEEASTAAGNDKGSESYRLSKLALEKMLEMLSENKSGFGGMCQGQMKFNVPKDLESTIRQMLQSLGEGRGKDGKGGAGLAGAGMMGGSPEDGYWMGGYSPLNMPLYGPGRSQYSAGGFVESMRGSGSGPGRRVVDERASERMAVTGEDDAAGQSFRTEDIPVKYRDAVRSYFSE